MTERMNNIEFFRWLDEQIPNADDLRKENPWRVYEAAKRVVKQNLVHSWNEYDYYQRMITSWAGVYR